MDVLDTILFEDSQWARSEMEKDLLALVRVFSLDFQEHQKALALKLSLPTRDETQGGPESSRSRKSSRGSKSPKNTAVIHSSKSLEEKDGIIKEEEVKVPQIFQMIETEKETPRTRQRRASKSAPSSPDSSPRDKLTFESSKQKQIENVKKKESRKSSKSCNKLEDAGEELEEDGKRHKTLKEKRRKRDMGRARTSQLYRTSPELNVLIEEFQISWNSKQPSASRATSSPSPAVNMGSRRIPKTACLKLHNDSSLPIMKAEVEKVKITLVGERKLMDLRKISSEPLKIDSPTSSNEEGTKEEEEEGSEEYLRNNKKGSLLRVAASRFQRSHSLKDKYSK